MVQPLNVIGSNDSSRAENSAHPRLPLVTRWLRLEPGEGAAVALSLVYHFCLLAAYYALRPVRDEIAAHDRDVIPALWTYTFFVMLVAAPAYAVLTQWMSRNVFIPIANLFFASNIVIFIIFMKTDPIAATSSTVERVFYVWASVFNLFVIAVFWGFMADLWRNDQGKRLFGLIAVGGTLGAMTGGLLTGEFVKDIGTSNVLIGSIVFLIIATGCAILLHRLAVRAGSKTSRGAASNADSAVRGHALNGLLAVIRSPYLLAICGFLLLYTATSSFLYFEKSEIVGLAISDRAERTQLYARADVFVNALTLFGQGFLIARLLRWIGVGLTLAALPLVTMLGFALLGFSLREEYAAATDGSASMPVLVAVNTAALWIVIAFDAFRRIANFVFAKPTREVLFTLVSRQEKYQSKTFIDTAVYRGGDMATGWAFDWMKGMGLSLSVIAWIAVPMTLIWGGLALMLGRMHDGRAVRTQADRAQDL